MLSLLDRTRSGHSWHYWRQMDHQSHEPMSWWESGRTCKAFAIAPLAAPLLVSLKFGFAGAPGSVVTYIAPIALAVAYVGTLLFGLPLYSLLRALRLTTFWLAPVAGFLLGIATMLLVFVVIGARNIDMLSEATREGGAPGAAVGALLWLIARPDRQEQPGEKISLPKWDWNTARVPIAFLVAPLAIPMLVTLTFVPLVPSVGFNSLIAYPIALLLSVPPFRILCESKLTGFWAMTTTGAAVGLATFFVLAMLSGGLLSALAEQSRFLILAIFGLSGAVAGTIFWAIARPDRDVVPSSSPSN